jgi:hypothetical protein
MAKSFIFCIGSWIQMSNRLSVNDDCSDRASLREDLVVAVEVDEARVGVEVDGGWLEDEDEDEGSTASAAIT